MRLGPESYGNGTGHLLFIQAAVEALMNAEDSLFLVPNANEAMRAKFATNGSMQAFYIGGHFMIHMGQVSAWRRMMGLGPA